MDPRTNRLNEWDATVGKNAANTKPELILYNPGIHQPRSSETGTVTCEFQEGLMDIGFTPDAAPEVGYMNFANKILGGGVLGNGWVQEEQMVWVTDLLRKQGMFTLNRKRYLEKFRDDDGANKLDKTPALIKCHVLARLADDLNKRGEGKEKRRDGRIFTNLDIPPIKANMLVAAAPEPLSIGRANATQASLGQWLETSKNLMALAASRNITTIATGLWGAGAFRLCATLGVMIQVRAAKSVNRDMKLIFYIPREPNSTQFIENIKKIINQYDGLDDVAFVRLLEKTQFDARGQKFYVPQTNEEESHSPSDPASIPFQQPGPDIFQGALSRGLPRGLQRGSPRALSGALQRALPPGGFPGGLPQGSPDGLPGGLPGGLPDFSLPGGVPSFRPAPRPGGFRPAPRPGGVPAAPRLSPAASSQPPDKKESKSKGILGAADGALVGAGAFIVVLASFAGVFL